MGLLSPPAPAARQQGGQGTLALLFAFPEKGAKPKVCGAVCTGWQKDALKSEPRSEAAPPPMSGRDHTLACACDFVLHHHCRSSRVMERHRTPAGCEWGGKPYKPGDCCPRPCRDRFNAGSVSLFCWLASLLKYLSGLSVKCCQEAAVLCLSELLQPIYSLLL